MTKKIILAIISFPLFAFFLCGDIIKLPLMIIFFIPFFAFMSLCDWLPGNYDSEMFWEVSKTCLILFTAIYFGAIWNIDITEKTTSGTGDVR
jgi:hypothetical protein